MCVDDAYYKNLIKIKIRYFDIKDGFQFFLQAIVLTLLEKPTMFLLRLVVGCLSESSLLRFP